MKNPPAERRIKVNPQDVFSKSMILTVSNEHKRQGGNLLSSFSVEIVLTSEDGFRVYSTTIEKAQALCTTAN